MIDSRLRPAVDRLLTPVTRAAAHVPPNVITVLAAAIGVAAAVLVAVGAHWAALACWLASRVLDGLDGAVARRSGTASDFGGYLDMTLDTVVYAAIPLGLAWHLDDLGTWALCAALIATFYVNVISWSYLAALLEKRGQGASTTGESTSITMPTGLVEGAETVVAYAVMLAFPSIAPWGFAVMAIAVLGTIIQRMVWARSHLR